MDGPTINNQESQWTIFGFNNRFDELIKEYPTYWAAYEQCEKEHFALFGKFRYNGYESFRVSRRSYLFKK